MRSMERLVYNEASWNPQIEVYKTIAKLQTLPKKMKPYWTERVANTDRTKEMMITNSHIKTGDW